MPTADTTTRSARTQSHARTRPLNQRDRRSTRSVIARLDDAGITVAVAAAITCGCLYLLLFAFAPAV